MARLGSARRRRRAPGSHDEGRGEPARAPGDADPPAVSPRRVALLLGGLVALAVVSSSAVAVALPVVAGELALGTGASAWVLAAFSLPFAVATALFGRLADRFGMRTPLRVGIGLMMVGSLLAAAAWSYPALIVGRVLTGAGAGAVPVLSAAIIAARFGGPQRARTLGGVTAVVGAVSGAGPLIGGGVTAVAGWRVLVALPALAGLVGEPIARLAPAAGGGRRRLDVAGAVLVAVTVAGGLLLLQTASVALPAGLGWVLAGLTVAGGAGVVGRVRRHPDGFLPHAVATNRPVVLYAVAGLGLVAPYLAMLVALPLLLAAQRGWGPLAIGVTLVPAAAAAALAARLVGRLAIRLGHRRLVAALGVASAAGALLAAAAHEQPVVLVGGLALASCGFAGGRVALLDGLADLVPSHTLGAAMGVFNLAYFTGGALGSVTAGALGDALGLPAVLAVAAAFPLASTAAAAGARCRSSRRTDG